MGYLIIADWDESFCPDRTNIKESEADAIALVVKLINDMPEGQEAPNAFYVENPGVDLKYITVDPETKTITVDTSQEDADVLAAALAIVKTRIDVAMFKRIEQGLRWAWSTQETVYSIALDASMRELLASWHQLLTQPTPEANPHNGFIKSGGVIIRGPGGNNIPDAAVVEIANFAGLLVSKFSQMAIAEKADTETFTLAQLQEYDAAAINWTVRDETIAGIVLTDWPAEKPDWSNDLCFYNP